MPPTSTLDVIARERKTTIKQIFRNAEQERLSPEQLAADLGMTPEALRLHLHRHGVKVIRTLQVPEDK